MKKGIVFVNHVTGYLFIDIINAAVPYYDNISLVTGRISEHQVPLHEKVKIHYLPEYKKGGGLRRLLYWILITWKIYFNIINRYRKYKIFYTSNPPIAPFISLFSKNHFDILIYDIFPDALVNDGFINQKSLINKIWTHLNRKVYRKAKSVYTISDGMASILDKYIDKNKIKVIPLWYSNMFRLDRINNENNPFIIKHNLDNKFIVMYSGNLAPGYDIEALIDLAEFFKDIADIMFIIIGDGWKFKKVERLINQRKLNNCMLLPILPSGEFKFSLSAADVGVVTTSEAASQLGVPSKVFNHTALGVPILCIAETDSELAQFVVRYDIGICCKKDEILKMADFIKRLKGNQQDYDYYAERSLLCSRDFSSANANRFFVETIQN